MVTAFSGTLTNPTNGSDFSNVLTNVLGIRPGTSFVTTYDPNSKTTSFFFQGPDAERAATTLLAMSEAQRIALLGLSGLNQKEISLSSLYPEESISDKQSTVIVTVFIVLGVNLALSGALLGIKAVRGTQEAAAPPAKTTTLSNIMDDVGPMDNVLPSMRPPPPPPPGAVAVNVVPSSPKPASQKPVSLQDLDLDLDFDDDDDIDL